MLDLHPILGCLEIKSRITPVEPPEEAPDESAGKKDDARQE